MSELPLQTPLLSRLVRRTHLLTDFLAVARAGGIRQAADEVAISQSALTRRIQELEDALGVALFERSVRGMSLTPFGVALKHHAQMVEMNCSYAATEISELLDGSKGELRIAAGPAWSYGYAPDAIAKLTEQLPGVKISMFTRMNEVTLPMLLAGELDVVLGGLPDECERSSELVYEPLIEVEHLVYAGRHHPLQGSATWSPDVLRKYPWIWFQDAVAARRLFAKLFDEAGIPAPEESVETTSMQFGFRLLSHSRHLMVLPSTLSAIAAYEDLVPLLLSRSIGQYTAGMMYRPSLQRLKAFRLFKDILAKSVG